MFDQTLTPLQSPLASRQMVVPKDIKDIPWRQRHGPILRAIMFHFWAGANEMDLAATFLQLSPQDLPFREMAYAALCLAAGGNNVNLLPSRNVSTNLAYGFIREGPEYNEFSEFVSILASGAHLQGFSPGTSPEGTMYWLDNILVVLTAQLHRPGVADEGISRIVLYCQKHRPSEYVDAVLISVEHVVLVRVVPGEKVRHTATMPLLDRSARPYHERLANEHENCIHSLIKQFRGTDSSHGMNSNKEEESDEEHKSALHTIRLDNNINSAFYALVHLFEGGACRHMRASTGPKKTGRLPNEIYSQIPKHVTDKETRYSLMKVSRVFRQACQEDLLFDEGSIIKPSLACQSCVEANHTPEWFEKYDLDSGIQSRVAWRRRRELCLDDLGLPAVEAMKSIEDFDRDGASRSVAIGTERNKKSLLAKVAFELVDPKSFRKLFEE